MTMEKSGRRNRVGGLESRLAGLGQFFLVLGVAGGLAGFLGSGDAANGRSAGWIAISIAAPVQGLAAFYFFRGVAEMIRLLKKMAGLPYGGEISEAHEPVEQEEDA